MSDIDPIEFEDDRRHGNRRRLFRFDPTVSSGTLLLVAQILAGFVIAYAQYTGDRARDEMRFEQLRKDVDGNRVQLTNTVASIQVDVKEVQRTLQDVSTSLAVLKAREPNARRLGKQDGDQQ